MANDILGQLRPPGSSCEDPGFSNKFLYPSEGCFTGTWKSDLEILVVQIFLTWLSVVIYCTKIPFEIFRNSFPGSSVPGNFAKFPSPTRNAWKLADRQKRPTTFHFWNVPFLVVDSNQFLVQKELSGKSYLQPSFVSLRPLYWLYWAGHVVKLISKFRFPSHRKKQPY